jgi:hypothetical protein
MRAFRLSVRSADGAPLDRESLNRVASELPGDVAGKAPVEQIYSFAEREVSGIYVLLRGASPDVSGVAVDLEAAIGDRLGRRVFVEVLD